MVIEHTSMNTASSLSVPISHTPAEIFQRKKSYILTSDFSTARLRLGNHSTTFLTRQIAFVF